MSFLPTGSITATVLSASSPLFVSDELLKPADQFEYPSNISMSRTCVYSPRKIYLLQHVLFNLFSMSYWAYQIFKKPTKSCVQVVVSICIVARRISEHPGTWKGSSWDLMKCLPTLPRTTKCTGLEHWNSRGNTLWINSLNVRLHQFCDRLHFRFVCVKLPLQSTPILLSAEEAYQEESKFLGKWKKINKSAPLSLWLGKNILHRRISICMWRILDNFSTASIHNTTNINVN